MSDSVLVGSAYAIMDIRHQQFDQGVDAVIAKLEQLRKAAATPITVGAGGAGAAGGAGPTDQEVKYQQALARTAEAEARRAAATARRANEDAKAGIYAAREATEEQKLAREIANTAAAEDRAATAALRRQQAEERAARAAGSGGLGPALPRTFAGFAGTGGEEFAQGISSGLLGVVGPAAVATAAIGAFRNALDFTEESFKLKAALDTTNASIKVQIQNFRDYGQIQREGSAFADKYRLTQEETQQAIQASIPILRQSKQSLTEVESTLLRLSVLKPEQGIEGAAFALAELQGGQTKSLETRFNIPIAKANELKKEIEAGGDAITVLGKYLDSAGVGMDALAVRTQGATGKMNELKVETEKFQLALGGQAGGPGEFILDQRINAARAGARVFSGDYKSALASIQETAAGGLDTMANWNAVGSVTAGLIGKLTGLTHENAAANFQQRDAILQSADAEDRRAEAMQRAAASDDIDIEQRRVAQLNAQATAEDRNTQAIGRSTSAKLGAKVQTQQLAEREQLLASVGTDVRAGLITAAQGAEVLRAYFGDAANAVLNLQLQLGKVGSLDISGSLGITAGNALAQQNADLESHYQHYIQGKKDAAALADSEIQLAQARGQNAKAIDLLKQKQAGIDRSTVAGQAEYNQIQAQIEGLNQKGLRSAASTATKLNDIATQSGVDRLRIERENLERLRDQQDDFDVRRSRSEEDYQRRRIKLLADGKIREAQLLAEEHAIDVRRMQEDFDRDKARTLRNNAEALGDQATRVDLQTAKAARGKGGVGASAAPDIGGAPAPLSPASAAASGGAATRVIQIQLLGTVNLDGDQVGQLIYPHIQPMIEDDIVIDLQQAGVSVPAGSRQSAVAGARP